MLVTKINKKTVTIEAEPGDRIDLDREGYAIQSMDIIVSPDEISKLTSLIRASKNGDQDAAEKKEMLKDYIVSNNRQRNVRRVFCGYSY